MDRGAAFALASIAFVSSGCGGGGGSTHTCAPIDQLAVQPIGLDPDNSATVPANLTVELEGTCKSNSQIRGLQDCCSCYGNWRSFDEGHADLFNGVRTTDLTQDCFDATKEITHMTQSLSVNSGSCSGEPCTWTDTASGGAGTLYGAKSGCCSEWQTFGSQFVPAQPSTYHYPSEACLFTGDDAYCLVGSGDGPGATRATATSQTHGALALALHSRGFHQPNAVELGKAFFEAIV